MECTSIRKNRPGEIGASPCLVSTVSSMPLCRRGEGLVR